MPRSISGSLPLGCAHPEEFVLYYTQLIQSVGQKDARRALVLSTPTLAAGFAILVASALLAMVAPELPWNDLPGRMEPRYLLLELARALRDLAQIQYRHLVEKVQ